MDALPEAILLDLDDTILDDVGSVVSSWADACAEAARRLPGLDPAALEATIRDYATSWWADPANNQRGRLNLREATAHVAREAFRRLGFDEPHVATGIANLYRDLREERCAVHEGAIETLEWLGAHGVRLGMMTNGAGPPQRAKIERFCLAQHFDHILIEGEFGCGKPDRRVFETLLRALKAHPSKTWAAGDNLRADVYGAMDAGIYGIWVDRTGRGLAEAHPWQAPAPDLPLRPPDRIIRSLRDLMDGHPQSP